MEAFDWFGAVDEDIVVQVVLHVGGADLGRLECVCGLFGRRGESGQTLCERVAVLRTEDHPNRAYCAPRRGETAKQLLHATEACAYGARAVASARHTVAVSADQVLMSCGETYTVVGCFCWSRTLIFILVQATGMRGAWGKVFCWKGWPRYNEHR